MAARTNHKRNSVRLSITLDEKEYAELGRMGAALDLSTAWMIRRAVSEFVARNRDSLADDLPLRHPNQEFERTKKIGGSGGH